MIGACRTPPAAARAPATRSSRAALDLVEEVGFSRTSVEGIAARAGVGKQTIYRWWPSKGAVLLDALLALSEGEEGVEPLPDTGDLAADLKLVLRATVEELSNPRYDAPMRALATEGLHDPALHAQWSERIDAPLTRIREERLRSAQQQGELPGGPRPRARHRPHLGPALPPLAAGQGAADAGVRRRARRRRAARPALNPGHPPRVMNAATRRWIVSV